MLELGIKPVIPSKENEDRSARPVEFDRDVYRRRSIVECLIGWLKECRRVFSRFEKTAKNFGGISMFASPWNEGACATKTWACHPDANRCANEKNSTELRHCIPAQLDESGRAGLRWIIEERPRIRLLRLLR